MGKDVEEGKIRNAGVKKSSLKRSSGKNWALATVEDMPKFGANELSLRR